jgi:hypothetical protein
MERNMEQEDQKWNHLYNEEIDIQTVSGKSYKVVTSGPTAYRHVDLSSVSTRDLLNECYRRRAIEKFDFKVDFDTYMIDFDTYMMQERPDTYRYVMKNVYEGLWDAVIADEKFSKDAIEVKQERITSHMRTVFRGEVYVCKHPTKVRK